MYNLFKYDAPTEGGGTDEGNTTATGGEGSPPPVETPVPSTPATPTEAKPIINDKGEFVENWMESLGDDYKDNSSLKNFTTLEGLAKSYVTTKSMVGKKQELGEFTSDEERNEFYSKLGKPEKADGYEMGQPDDHPEGMPYDQEQVNWFGNVAHKYNLTKEQAQGIRNEFYDIQKNAWVNGSKEVNAEYEQSVVSLKQEWGQDYDRRINIANRAVQTFGAAEDLQDLGLDNNPKLVNLFYNIGNKMGEDRLVTGESPTGGQTPDELKAKISELNAHPAYLDRGHAEHKSIVKEVFRLQQLLHPE